LAAKCSNIELDDFVFPWEHLCYSEFSDANKELLKHAERFSDVIFGAVLAYNYYLAQRRNNESDHNRIKRYNQDFIDWFKTLKSVERWNLDRLWKLLENEKHTITQYTKIFLKDWVVFINDASDAESLLQSERLKKLIEEREKTLKKSKSRFINEKALQQWSGASGLHKLNYRWHNVKVLLEDLYQGLKRGNDA
jgi:hypothetical protein